MKTKNKYAKRNALLRELGYASYADYLKGQLWGVIRRVVLDRFPTCTLCDDEATQVHHTRYTYKNLRSAETAGEDLLAICRPCHQYIETKSDGTKETFKMTSLKLACALTDREKFDLAKSVTNAIGRAYWKKWYENGPEAAMDGVRSRTISGKKIGLKHKAKQLAKRKKRRK